jgi:hypothetical protein
MPSAFLCLESGNPPLSRPLIQFELGRSLISARILPPLSFVNGAWHRGVAKTNTKVLPDTIV